MSVAAQTIGVPVAPSPSRRLAIGGAVVFVVIVLLAYGFNVAILEDIRSRDPETDMTLLRAMTTSVFSWIVGFIVIIGIAKAGELISDRKIGVGKLTQVYLVASLWHVLSGVYVLLLAARPEGLPPVGEPITFTFNPFGWEGTLGRYLGTLTVDELGHLVTFGWWVSHLYGWRRPWLVPTLLALWLGHAWVTGMFWLG